MNLEAESLAAAALAFLLAAGQFVEERFGWDWPDWKMRDGVVLQGEMADFDWESKSLILRGEGDGLAQRIAAEDLTFWSKVRMLCSAPYQDRMANHLAELEAGPGFRPGLERLEKAGMVFLGAYLVLFTVLNWLMAGWLHRSGSILRWLGSVAVFLVLSALAVWLVMACFRQFGPDQVLEYVILAGSIHTVLYVFLVWVIYQSGPFRALIWYGLCWVLALALPLTLGGTVLAAQVRSHGGALDLAGCDRYLTEVWLRPMGLL